MNNLVYKILVVSLSVFIAGCMPNYKKSNFNLYAINENKEDYAVVYIYRNKTYPTWMPVEIKINDNIVATLRDHEFTKIYVKLIPIIRQSSALDEAVKARPSYKKSMLAIISTKWFAESQVDSNIMMLLSKDIYYVKLNGVVIVGQTAFEKTTYLDSSFEHMPPIMAENELKKCCVYKKPIREFYDLNVVK